MATAIQLRKPFLRAGARGAFVRELQELLQKYARFVHNRSISPGPIMVFLVNAPRQQS
ncbi:MAG: hypothetical protein HC805_07775 [Alkalinema sp. RL_2_19]|nr:hypothetical protein [Alkalinema sp. RL_2_19]